MPTSVRGFVRGRVQGVGFRYFVRRCAQAQALTGYAINLPDGRVEFMLQGDEDAIARAVALIRGGPPHARVDRVSLDAPIEAETCEGFTTG